MERPDDKVLTRKGIKVCAFTAVCEEDYDWVGQYLDEAQRLRLPFAVHLDRCSASTRTRMVVHPLCVASTYQQYPAVEFTEQHKQGILDKVADLGYDWAMAWDVDETYERHFTDLLTTLGHEPQSKFDQVSVRWLNLWGDRDRVRVDQRFGSMRRVKFYNLQGGRRWDFDHPITNGAKLAGDGEAEWQSGAVCLHHGMMTPALRRLHRERWDRIYSTALRGDPNPYSFWKNAIETEAEAVTIRHGYF